MINRLTIENISQKDKQRFHVPISHGITVKYKKKVSGKLGLRYSLPRSKLSTSAIHNHDIGKSERLQAREQSIICKFPKNARSPQKSDP